MSTKSKSDFLTPYIRVLKMARKPSDDPQAKQEFKQISLITSVGAVVIGLLGFVVFTLMGFLPV